MPLRYAKNTRTAQHSGECTYSLNDEEDGYQCHVCVLIMELKSGWPSLAYDLEAEGMAPHN